MKNFALALVMLFLTGSVFGAETKVTKEQRQKMAEVHSKMAACLKSDKPLSECHKEMLKSCHDMMGKDGCPMMGEMHGMQGACMHDEDEGEGK